MLELKEMNGQTRWRKMEVNEISRRQILIWEQHSITCGNSLSSHGTTNLRRWLKTNRLAPQAGIWDAAVDNSAPEHLLAFHGKHWEQFINWGFNRLTSTASYQSFIEQIPSAICPRCGSGEEAAEHLLLFCPKWAAERQQYFDDSINVSDVFQDDDNLVEFLILLGHLSLHIGGANNNSRGLGLSFEQLALASISISWFWPWPHPWSTLWSTQPSTLRGMVKWVLVVVKAIAREETASSAQQ